MRTSCRFHQGLPDGIHICHGKDDSYLGREVDSKECNKGCKTYERITKDGTVVRLKDIKKSVLRLGDPWTLRKRTRFWSNGTHTGDGMDLIKCRDIVYDLHEFWTRGGKKTVGVRKTVMSCAWCSEVVTRQGDTLIYAEKRCDLTKKRCPGQGDGRCPICGDKKVNDGKGRRK